MDDKNIYPIILTAINLAIILTLSRSFYRHFKGRSSDANFHTRMLLLCTLLLIANTFALITGLYGYFVLKVVTPEILNYGRFADRYTMFFAYLALEKMDER